MANLVLYMFLILVMVGHSSATWCVCKDGNDAALQKTLDYACGAGGDCNPIHQNGPCFNPNTVRAHCNYAVNSYFQKKGQTPGTCDFAGTATIVTSDPSTTGCSFPASASGSTSNSGMPTGKPSTTSSGYNNPLITTPTSNGVAGGGVNNGFGANGSGLNTDYTGGGNVLTQKMNLISSSCMTIVVLALVFRWT